MRELFLEIKLGDIACSGNAGYYLHARSKIHFLGNLSGWPSKDPATLKTIAAAILRAIEILAPEDHPMPYGQVPTSMENLFVINAHLNQSVS